LEHLEKLTQCPICFDGLWVASLLVNCGHTFCNSCIRNWGTHDDKCPLCREINYDAVRDPLVEEMSMAVLGAAPPGRVYPQFHGLSRTPKAMYTNTYQSEPEGIRERERRERVERGEPPRNRRWDEEDAQADDEYEGW
jgi:hypothetical protein